MKKEMTPPSVNGEKFIKPEVSEKQVIQEDLKNLEAIFTLARHACVNDEPQLINVINFKQIFFEKLKLIIKEK